MAASITTCSSYQILDLWYIIFSVWYLIFSVWYLICYIWHLIISVWYLIFSVWYLKCDIWCLFCWTGARWHQQHCAPWILIHRHFLLLFVMMRQEFGRWWYLMFADYQSCICCIIFEILFYDICQMNFDSLPPFSSLLMRQEFGRWQYLIFADYQNL